MQGIDHQKARLTLSSHNALLNDRLRKQRGCRSDIILHKHSIHVGIRPHIECYLQVHRAIRAAYSIHIEHIAHTHNILRYGCSHTLRHTLCISTGICCRDLDNRWCNIWILLNREL